MNARPYVIGYTDEWSVQPGDSIDVFLDAHELLTATVDLVRMGAGEPDGRVDADHVMDIGELTIRPQTTCVGSCVRVQSIAGLADVAPLTVTALIMPSRLGLAQSVVAAGDPGGGWWLGVDARGRPSLTLTQDGDTVWEVIGSEVLVEGAWYLLAGGTTPDGLRLIAQPLPMSASWRTGLGALVRTSDGTTAGPRLSVPDGSPLFIGARSDGSVGWQDSFDGKIESPRLHRAHLDERFVQRLVDGESDDQVLVAWDLGVGDDPLRSPTPWIWSAPGPALAAGTTSVGPAGEVLNSPTRAVTGARWSGRALDPRWSPDEYAAAHFHSDDLDDCRWQRAARFRLPNDLASGVYGVRTRSGNLIDYIPIFVRPRRAGTDIAVLIPTASYLAYANDHPASDGDLAEAVAGRTPVVRESDLLLHEHREWGLSCYDAHADGSGVVHSSRRRPLVNMRPTHRYHVGAWQLPADLVLVSWLRSERIEVDVITDEDLERDGAALLTGYSTVLTGTHPEYTTTRMLDALADWLDSGGRLVYLGANGFYWRAAFDPHRPWVLELRRGQAGSRAWESAPGESHLQSTGELGGLWRHLGRSPQRIVGVGYAAQGFDRCGHYERLPDSDDPRAAFVFEGVDGRTFGTAGRIGGGAAGQELDRYDVSLGTPTDALLLATSAGLSDGYHRCVEEIGFTVAGTSATYDPKVRADVVYHVRPGGGAVFATGSIAWIAALGIDDGVTTITRNVIGRFRDSAPLEWMS